MSVSNRQINKTMEQLKAVHFTAKQDLVEFVNSNGIKREDILTIVRGHVKDYTLFYYQASV